MTNDDKLLIKDSFSPIFFFNTLKDEWTYHRYTEKHDNLDIHYYRLGFVIEQESDSWCDFGIDDIRTYDQYGSHTDYADESSPALDASQIRTWDSWMRSTQYLLSHISGLGSTIHAPNYPLTYFSNPSTNGQMLILNVNYGSTRQINPRVSGNHFISFEGSGAYTGNIFFVSRKFYPPTV